MTDAPQVSVVIVVRNGMPYLPQSVQSVLGQTFEQFELLVIDDGSTDDTPRYMSSVADARVRYHRLEEIGLTGVRNFGLEHARAPLVAVLDADDVACPTRLAEQHAYMTEQEDCSVLGSQAEEIDEEGRPGALRRYPLSDAAIRWRMFFGCPILQPSAMIRRERALACGGYRPEFPNAEDYDLWTRMAGQGKLANHPEALVQYRVHARSMTSSRREEQMELCGRIAASYAVGVFPELNEKPVADLYHFLCTGREPRQALYGDLTKTYRQIKDGFLCRINPPEEELNEWIAAVQQTLRWYCVERAEKNVLRPWRAWTWLRRAGMFDPDEGTIVKIFARALRRAVRARGTHRKPEAPSRKSGSR